MSQILDGVDIYQCKFFNLDSGGVLKFARGKFYNKSPKDFKTLVEINDVLRYCFWIIENPETPNVSKFCAIKYQGEVQDRIKYIENIFKKKLREEQKSNEKNLSESVSKPGRKYI